MQLSSSSLYVSLKQLREKLYDAQFLMDRSARIVYGSRLMDASADSLKYFTMAYTNKSRKMEYLDMAIGSFAVLRTDIEMCMSHNIIHYKRMDTACVEMLKTVAKIDDELCRWQASLAKGTTIVA